MKNIFNRRKRNNEDLRDWGCLSRREDDFVVIAEESGGGLTLSRLSREASLETLRLQGKIRTAVSGYHARATRLEDLHFPVEADQIQIGQSYIEYLRKQSFNLKEKNVAYTLDEMGVVASNSARIKDVTEAAVSVEGFRARVDDSCPVEVESRGRAAFRLYLNQNIEVGTTNAPGLTLCSVVIEDKGYSILFWNAVKGICWETEQPFTETEAEDNWSSVADEIKRLIMPASIESLNLTEVDQILLTGGEECSAFLRSELGEENIEFEQVQFIEGKHYFLADGSQRFKDNDPSAVIAAGLFIRDARVPSINLNQDLEQGLRLEAEEQVQMTQRRTQRTNRNLTILLAAPAVVTIICLAIFYGSLFLKDGLVTKRQEAAKAKETELSQTVAELKSIKESADTVQAVGTQIEALRKRQPANFLLLMTLNRIFPGGNSAWQIDEITSKADGTVTIKGKTTSDESLSDFVKNLDFSESFGSVKASKDESGGANFINDGVKKFVVEARYLPLAAPGSALPQSTQTAPPPLSPSAPAANPIVTNPAQIAGQETPKKPNS